MILVLISKFSVDYLATNYARKSKIFGGKYEVIDSEG